MPINITLQRNLNRGGRLNSAYPLGNEPAQPLGQVKLAWDLPNQYTDSSKLFVNSFIIRYGTVSGGPYPNAVDMTDDTDPAALQRTIDNLDAGTTYYFVMQTVDSEGFVSAESDEFSMTAQAAVPDIVYPETFTEVRQADLPLTINSSGNYRIMENIDYDVDQGVGISIAASDVKLFAHEDDNIVFTTCTTGDVSGVGLVGQLSNIEIFGYHISHNGHLTTSSYSHGCIYLSNSGNACDGLDIHHMQFTVGQPNANMTGASSAFGGVVLSSPNGVGVRGAIHHCTFNLRGTKSGSGVRGVMLSSGGSNPYLVAHDNVVNCSDVSGSVRGYQRPFIGVHEAHSNTINVTDCAFTSYGITGIVNADYTHNNTFNVANSNALRGIIIESDKADSVHLYNSINITSVNAASSDIDIRLYRVRFGANNTIIGFSSAQGNGTYKALALLDLYGNEDADLTRDTYVYHNDAQGMKRGLINVQEQAENTYLWGNTANATNEYGLYLRCIGAGDNANGFYTDGDNITGSISDVMLQTITGAPAVENTHFAGMGAVNFSKVNSIETVRETHYWLDGDAGLITHTMRNTGSKTPNAPTNLRAA